MVSSPLWMASFMSRSESTIGLIVWVLVVLAIGGTSLVCVRLCGCLGVGEGF